MNKTMEKEYKWRADEWILGQALLWASSRIGSQSQTLHMQSQYFDTLDGLLQAGWSPSDEFDTPERHALNREKSAEIRRVIAELPEDMRAAVVLRDIEGMSYEEIARVLDINVGTIKSRISRARAKLREILSAQMELFDRPGV